jgi:hypothetical protein
MVDVFVNSRTFSVLWPVAATEQGPALDLEGAI